MRNAFFKTLEELAEKDKRIFLVVGDLGYSYVENFRKKFPKQFLNTGVAEQNMTGVAAGLALSGKIVFTYSIGNFPSLRPLEQIRNDICYHNANVKIVSVGTGVHYGVLGFTHQATEDMAIMRDLPNMTIITPSDPLIAGLATKAIVRHSGPAYLRLGGREIIYKNKPIFEIGKAILTQEGKDITIISTGAILNLALETAMIFKEKGVSCRVLDMHTAKPIDGGAIIKAARETGNIITLEEHNITGGLGSAVAEVLLDNNISVKFKRFGLKDEVSHLLGDRKFLLEKSGLSAEEIYKKSLELIGR